MKRLLFPAGSRFSGTAFPNIFSGESAIDMCTPFQRAACALLYNATKTGCVLPACRTGLEPFSAISVQSFSEEKRNSEGFCPAYV